MSEERAFFELKDNIEGHLITFDEELEKQVKDKIDAKMQYELV